MGGGGGRVKKKMDGLKENKKTTRGKLIIK
jgi:hypothetical protein